MQGDWVFWLAVASAVFALGGLVGSIGGRRQSAATSAASSPVLILDWGPNDMLIFTTDETRTNHLLV